MHAEEIIIIKKKYIIKIACFERRYLASRKNKKEFHRNLISYSWKEKNISFQ